MSWPQRGNFGRGNYGRGYPGYASLTSQGNEYQSNPYPANFSQWGMPFFGQQWQIGFNNYYTGNEHQLYPVDSQRGGPFWRGQGRGFDYVGNENQPYPPYSQRGGSFNRGQGRGFGYVENQYQLYPVYSQRGGFSYRQQGRGFGNVRNEYQSRPTNSKRGMPFNRKQGHGFSPNFGNEYESQPANSQGGGSFSRERGHDFSSVVGNEHESQPVSSQRGGSISRERGRGFNSDVGSKHKSQPVNNQRGGSMSRGRGFNSDVGSKHKSQPVNSQRGGSISEERGSDFSSDVGNEHKSQPANSQRGKSLSRERGRGFSADAGDKHKSQTVNSQRDGSHSRERDFSSDAGIKQKSQPANSQRGKSVSRERGRDSSQRGRGQHHRGNRAHDCSQGTSSSRDVNSSYNGHKDTWRSGITSSKPTLIPSSESTASTPPKKEEPNNEVVPKPQQKYLDFPFIEHHETVSSMPQFRVMFVLRGLPGSGKSTIAEAILKQYGDNAVVCSANYYHYQDGEYVWNRDKLPETHRKCQEMADKYVALNKPVVTIDNTNVKKSEVETYINKAKQHGYVVVLVEPRTPWKRQARELASKNIHNVPYTTISKRLEQFDEILPQYFGWFVSPADCVVLQTTAKDILLKCLQITDFQQCIKEFSGCSSPNVTVHNALSYYFIKDFDRQDFYHVTACFSPQGKYLAGSRYHKSPAVEKALGKISQVSIIGYVITNDTFSARVTLTEEQRALWMNDTQTGQLQQRKRLRGHATGHQHSVEEMTESFQHLPLDENGNSSERPGHCTSASAHITLGTKRHVSRVHAKYDVQTVVNYELSSRVSEEYALQGDIGTVRKYSDSIWAVYFDKDHVVKVPVIFSGYYG